MYRPRSNNRTGGFIGMEYKFLDSAVVGHLLTNDWDLAIIPVAGNALNAIEQGDGQSERNGRKCTLTSIGVKGRVVYNPPDVPAVGKQYSTVRLLVVWDKQTNGAITGGSRIITNIAPAVFGFRNLEFTQRFVVLMDKTIQINDRYNGSPTREEAVSWDFYKKLNIPVLHNGTTGNINNIVDNALNVYCIADGESTYLDMRARVRFVG